MGMVNPFDNQELLKNLCDSKINLVSMEFVPRITRAQKMDVLSSQANLAGYTAVIEASSFIKRHADDDIAAGPLSRREFSLLGLVWLAFKQ